MLASAPHLAAQEMPDSGGAHHDMHHDAAQAGAEPRLGQISFATSASPAAHRAFIRGMLYLHNFHYPQAAAAFREAQALDPGDVMSYWGEAVSYTHPVWNEQDTAAARAALRRLAPTPAERLAKARTRRERAWLASAEALYDDDVSKARRDTLFTASLDTLRTAYPHDIEAQLFYALSLLGLNQGDRDVPTYLRAYAIARRVFAAHPNHPGAAHYVIHAVDDPAHAALGLDAARAYSRIAPDAAHAQHMTSHIFIALGMWDDVIAANVRAQHPLHPGARVTYGHGAQWLIYGLLQEGRYAESARWVDSMRAQTARFAQGREEGVRRGAGQPLVSRARPRRVRRRHARVAVAARDARDRHDRARRARPRGERSRARAGGAGARRARACGLDSRATRCADGARARGRGETRVASERGYAEVIEKVLGAAVLHAGGEREKAVALAVAAAAQDDSLPFAFGPPVEIVSPHELAGEYLLELNRASDAEREYKLALARAPGRTAALIGLAKAQLALGQRADARRTYQLAAKNFAGADSSAVPPAITRAAGGSIEIAGVLLALCLCDSVFIQLANQPLS